MSDVSERENLAEAERDSDLKFFGFKGRSCGERNHVTDGRDSAWCLDCSEWCHVEGGRCRGCEASPAKRAAERLRAERDEALGLLRKLADWADLAYRDVARPDGAKVIADALAFVERTSRGGAGSGHGSAAEALEDET